jgi:hypothetical protein
MNPQRAVSKLLTATEFIVPTRDPKAVAEPAPSGGGLSHGNPYASRCRRMVPPERVADVIAHRLENPPRAAQRLYLATGFSLTQFTAEIWVLSVSLMAAER